MLPCCIGTSDVLEHVIVGLKSSKIPSVLVKAGLKASYCVCLTESEGRQAITWRDYSQLLSWQAASTCPVRSRYVSTLNHLSLAGPRESK